MDVAHVGCRGGGGCASVDGAWKMNDKLSALLNPILLTLFIAWGIWSWDQVNGVHACVIERNVVQLDANGRSQVVRVQIVGRGRL